MKRPFPRSSLPHKLAAVAVIALGLTGTALAQPGGPHGGPHGSAGADGMLARALHAASARLNLNTSQQHAWDAAVAQSKAARQAIRANRLRVEDALRVELGKAEPDFAAIAAQADDAAQQNRAQHTAARNQWLTVYATLSPEQKLVVRDIVAQRLSRLDAFRARVREHVRRHAPGNG